MSTSASEESLPAYLRRFSPSPSPNRDPDAGLREIRHYERKLPKWRYRLRQRLIPIVRWETPYLARMQAACRSHVLDSYFAFTANLGTHTFFMMSLPICFWCGFPNAGIALVHMLALGVYLSGVVKDLVCLPRPLSPPLQRITMSGSAVLEYGFPSTHTTNAVSVAVFGLHQLYQSREDLSAMSYNLMSLGCIFYATSIMLGRMYCGMHGFFDIAVGALLGACIAWIRVVYGHLFDLWITEGSWVNPTVAALFLAMAVRFHPEPADNCPCFDDSVAFSGVVMGIELGAWHRVHTQSWSEGSQTSFAELYAYTNQDLFKSVLRVNGGIVVIFAWRSVMKPLLLRSLPPLFRFVDHWGINLPRRYFLQAREYGKVPPLRKDDNVIPSAAEIPSILSSFHTLRRRRVSVGPQSEADAREFLANRAQRRGESRPNGMKQRDARQSANQQHAATKLTVPVETLQAGQPPESLAEMNDNKNLEALSPASMRINDIDVDRLTPPTDDSDTSRVGRKEDEKNDSAMFSALLKPRTHYDVEVITKLIVYAGIAWLAVEGNPLLFERVGLGPDINYQL